MTSRHSIRRTTALTLGLILAGAGGARGQLGARYPSIGQFGTGQIVGANSPGNLGVSSLGYGIRTGQVGPGYRSTYGLYRQAYSAPRAQTTVALQPLYSAITSLPGWNGPTGHAHRRYRPRREDPPIPHYDRNGKILWPGMVLSDASSAGPRREAEEAFLAVYHESKSTGHASIRPVIRAKEKLSAYERKVLPGIKGRSVADGDNLEHFFVDLDRSLDQMNAVF